MRRILQPLTALASLAIVGGIIYWGVTIAQLDPNSVPVIAKLNGPARVAPADPGGLRADHQGLAVNAVQAQGGVEMPTQRVVIAPRTMGLTSEDVAGANLVALIKDKADAAAPKSVSADPMTRTAPTPKFIEAPQQVASLNPIEVAPPAPLPANIIRPRARPASLASLVVRDIQQVAALADPVSKVALGSKLVQLGAFDTLDDAKRQWSLILKSNRDLLGQKDYIIQPADSGGRKFFRLRVVGFKSANDARALCTALKSRKTPCLAVTAR